MAKIIASIIALSLISSTIAQTTLSINGLCRDFTPSTNPDFERYLGDDRGIFQSTLGTDGIPVYSGGYHSTVTSSSSVYQWYRDTSASMGPYTIPITLTHSSNGYDFDNQAWFPLDNMGFGNYGNTGHNFAFTCVFNTRFTYRAGAGQIFTFSGDDDVFVFINRKLAIDLGGVHGPETGSVNLDSIASNFGMSDQGTYNLDVFQNERHTSGSTFHMTTDIVLVAAPPASVCGNGVIEGSEQCDGGSCCSSSCTFSPSSSTCRASAGPCDIAETCTGSSSSCPADSFQSSSTVCRASAGVCDVAETCSGLSASCPADSFQSSSTVCRASVGPCDPAESCTGSTATCPADSNGSFETACPGLSVFPYYDVIAFGNFNGNTGDIEQRLAVGGNFQVGNGWSVGYEIRGTDGHEPYSLLVNGNANWPSGAVYPLPGNVAPYNSQEEDIFVGGTFTGSSDLAQRVTGTCTSPNCLSSQFSAAQSCYAGFQNSMSNNVDNVEHYVQWSGLYVTCSDSSATNYFMTLQPSEMTFTWFDIENCNSNAAWVINIAGTSDITFAGASFPYPANQVTWNIVGSGRNINVGGIMLNGNVLAPYNNIVQPNGVIVGKVIANNIQSLQINRQTCFTNSYHPPSPTPPTHICGNGVVESGEDCDGGDCCTTTCSYVSSSTVCRASVSQCDAAEMCTGHSATCPPDVNWGIETACAGLDFPIHGGDYSFTDFDVIVYGDFNAGTGDVERRLAVEGNFVAGAGWSVGYQIDSSLRYVPYSLVVGGNANWQSGDIYPDGTGTPNNAQTENMFVGGAFYGSSNLASRVTGSCSSSTSSHCLDSSFHASQTCYGSYQSAMASNTDNVAHVTQYSTISVTCNSATAMHYYLTLTDSEINSATAYSISNCNADAQWTINVGGNGDVSFSGGSFPVGAPQVVFNILGSGRTINVGTIQFDGSLIAPYNILHQTGGVIIGKVVVASVTSFVQMNEYQCYEGHAQSSFYVTD